MNRGQLEPIGYAGRADRLRSTVADPTWAEVAPTFALLGGWCVVVLVIGWVTLRRRIERI